MKLLLIFAGGGLGSLLRYGFSRWLSFSKITLPLHTLTANLLACLLLGIFTGIAMSSDKSPDFNKYFLMTGLCGGFSTFSTFAFEIQDLYSHEQIAKPITYLLASIIFGVLAVLLGLQLSKWITA